MADQLKIALSHFQAGNLDEALTLLNDTLGSTPKNAFAWFLSAIIHMQKHNIKATIAAFETALKYQPIYPEALNNMGVALEANDRIKEAENSYQKAISQKKDYANAYYNLANIQKNSKYFDRAIENYLLAIKYKPDYSNAMNNLALIYQYHGNYSKSETLFKKALNISKNDPEITNNLGHNYYCQHQYSQSLDLYQSILNTIPNYGPTLLNFGLLMKATGDLSKARKYFNVLSSNPDFHSQAMNNLAHLELSVENYKEGWEYYRYRPSMRNKSFSTFNALDSLPLFPKNEKNEKKILIYRDQGLGDEIFLSRYLPLLKDAIESNLQNVKLSYFTDERLTGFWRKIFKDITIITDTPTLSNFDHTISIGDLPYFLYKEGYTEIPVSISLTPEKTIVEKMKNLLPNNGKPNIAVTWEAGVIGQNTLFKKIPPRLLGQALSALDANILVIQRTPKPKDIKELEKALGRKTFNYPFANENLDDMLALLSLIDEYVCVSNTNTHLMAALNKASHVFIPHPPEWRWLLSGDHSPWQPLSKIYRQDSNGNWENAISSFSKVLSNMNNKQVS